MPQVKASPGRRARVATRPVEILYWPGDAERRAHLARESRPRLLVLDAGAAPPPPLDDLEDVVVTPIDEGDLLDRLARLSTILLQPQPLASGEVSVDSDGVLQFHDHWLWLPPAEAAIVRALNDPPGRAQSRAALRTAVWGDEPRRPRALDSRIFTLRTRLVDIGLAVDSLRGQGYALTARRS